MEKFYKKDLPVLFSETDAPELFNIWIEKWSDIDEFEIIPVLDSPTREPMRIQQTSTTATDA